MSKPGLDRFVVAARDAGCTEDQVRNFLSAGYVPLPWQLRFHGAARQADGREGPDQIGCGGARGPGKSHAVFAQVALDDCRRYPGLKALYLRKIGKNAREQFEDLRRTVLAHVKHDYNRNSGLVTLWDDSRIVIGHFKDEKDVDSYLGIEYDVIAIEETTGLSPLKYQTLRDSNRTSKLGWRARTYNSTNPGNIGHGWYKKRFVEPHRAGQETYTRFIPATVEDNVFIDPDYRRKLEENSGWRLRAYRYGDWDIAAGQYFSTWKHEAHVIAPFAIPLDWPVWMGMDYGFQHPTVFVVFTQDGDGNMYLIGEWVAARTLPAQHVAGVAALLGRLGRTIEQVWPVDAGSDVFAKKDATAATIAEQYAELGLSLRPANVDRINGAGRLLGLLGDVDRGQVPRLFVFEGCVTVIEQIPAMIHNPNRPEDVLKVDVDDDGNGGDDGYDALRYGLMAAGINAQASVVVEAVDVLDGL